MKSLKLLSAAIFTLSLGFSSCDDEDKVETEEPMFTFAADGTPELICESGIDFDAMYAEFKGKMLDDSNTRHYLINRDGTVKFMCEYRNWNPVVDDPNYDYYAWGNKNIYNRNFPDYYGTLYWDEDGLYMYRLYSFHTKILNYPVNETEEEKFIKRFHMPLYDNDKIVKFNDGKLGIVYKGYDGSWKYMDNIGVFPDHVAERIREVTPLEYDEAWGDRWDGKPYTDPTL